MKRPWQIWTVFIMCLVVVIPAMIWLTIKVIEIDRARADAVYNAEEGRVKAEQQEVISNALWRMDWLVAPLVAQEAARPYFFYEPFYTVADNEPAIKSRTKIPTTRQIPSPLLLQKSDYVKVHFQINANGTWICPQEPQGEQFLTACQLGLQPAVVEQSSSKIDELKMFCSPGNLLAQLPKKELPQFEIWNDDNDGIAMNYQGNQYLDGDLGELNQMKIARGARSGQQQKQEFPQTWTQQQKVDIPPRGRGNSSYALRNDTAQQESFNRLVQQKADALNLPIPAPDKGIREGISRTVWIDDQLIIARRVNYRSNTLIQGCWLDWEKIKGELIDEISDLITDVELEPVPDVKLANPAMMLASLPVKLTVGNSALASINTTAQITPIRGNEFSAINLALLAAWIGLFVAAGSTAYLLQEVIKLSERRATFVSAVTHELRTPLTTFRMYSEMLAEDMVTDPQQKKEYAGTLRVEADRLAHLVENVLQYARLERGNLKAKQQQIQSGKFIESIETRLNDRCESGCMKLQVDIDENATEVSIESDPDAIEQILFNLVENACKYATSADDKRIILTCQKVGQFVEYIVRDFGPGIPKQKQSRVFQPFSKSDQEAADTAQGVGLGLSLCLRLATQLGGTLKLNKVDQGASFSLLMPIAK